MRSLSRLLTVAALAALCAGPALADDLAVGTKAPDFTLEALDGSSVSLGDYAGKVVVLEWINPNCPFSLRHSEEKTMTGLASGHPDVVWLAINSTNPEHKDFLKPEEHATFNKEHGIQYPVLYDRDGKVAAAYHAKTTPHMYVIGTDGMVAYNGAIDDNPRGKASRNYVGDALGEIGAGRSADPSATKPYGCSLKL